MHDAVSPLHLRFRVKSRSGACSLSPSAHRHLDTASRPPSVGGERPSRTARPKAAELQPASCVPQTALPRELEPSRGVEPRSARYRHATLPLSYNGEADSLGHDPNTAAGTHCLAGRHGNLAVCAVLVWRSAEGSNPPTRQVSIPVFRTGGRPFSRNAPRESGTRGGIRTHTADGLNVVPPADWATRAWCSGRDSNPHLTASRTASSAELGYPSWYGSWDSNPD